MYDSKYFIITEPVSYVRSSIINAWAPKKFKEHRLRYGKDVEIEGLIRDS
jgi:hypothetical protein